jgi:hypothetical protein
MTAYTCDICDKIFKQKGHYDTHKARKRPCKKNDAIERMVEQKVKEVLSKTNAPVQIAATPEKIDYIKKNIPELKALCKKLKIKGISGKSKAELIIMLEPENVIVDTPAPVADSTDENNIDLLSECMKALSIKEVSDKLNLCVGTVRRWQELKDVPVQYTFDLHKLLTRDIDYSKFTSSSKDQFFTPALISKRCWNTFNEVVNVDISQYTFIEPSAGDGSFMKILPAGSIGLDIEPRGDNIQKQDYLSWKPSDLTKKYIVFGNPPFGLRGHLALNFINHSHEFADYVCFILPQLFESDGKGSPRKRVNGYNLIHSETLSAMFYSPENQEVKVNGVFQIWSKFTKNPLYQLVKPSEEKMKVYSLSDGGTVASTRNKNMIGKCDLYLPSTCFGKENMKLYDSFDKLPGKKGYGVVFFKDKQASISKAKTIDWSSVAFLSTNSAYNLRTSIVFSQFV